MRMEPKRSLNHLYKQQDRTNPGFGDGWQKSESEKYLTFAGVLLLIREVRCGILQLSEGCALHCPT